MTIPRLIIAGPASGCGKTTVATGLMAALRGRGIAVSGHKVGPDYIDPGYHALATRRPGRNLDPFLCGEEMIGPLFAHGADGAQIAVIEGVMGLFDGVAAPDTAGDGADVAVPDTAGGGADFASTAHVARLLRAPVILVVDAAAAGRSVAALVAGFAAFDPRVRIAGVIFNRVGSQRHERLLREAVFALGVRVFGAIPRADAVVTPSRHLGLVPAAERRAASERAVAQMAGLVASSCDLNGLRAVAAEAPRLAVQRWDPAEAVAPHGSRSESCVPALSSVRATAGLGSAPAPQPAVAVAVAEGPAFTFGYTEHRELLEAAGARLAPVDPLSDEDLPAGTAGLVIGGGFPQVYASELSENAPLRRRVAALAAVGAPVVAECAGLLYLARSLDGLPMCGVLGVTARMTGKLTLGYRKGRASCDSVLARAGQTVRGHEFHRTAAEPGHGPRPAWRLEAEGSMRGVRTEGHVADNVVASYLHLHWARTPSFAVRLLTACRASAVNTAGGSP